MLPYDDLLSDLRGLYAGERDPVANAANTAAAIWQHLPDINWAGFYFLKQDELVLGPFHGKPACVRIAMGKGRVRHGGAAERDGAGAGRAQIPRPHCLRQRLELRDRGAADPRGKLIGVLDIDSPSHDRFADTDRVGCEAIRRRRTSPPSTADEARAVRQPAPARGPRPQHRVRYRRGAAHRRAAILDLTRERARDRRPRRRVRLRQIGHRAGDHAADRLCRRPDHRGRVAFTAATEDSRPGRRNHRKPCAGCAGRNWRWCSRSR